MDMADPGRARPDLVQFIPPRLLNLASDAATVFRDFWKGYWNSPPGC
jgi:hypothetical protein